MDLTNKLDSIRVTYKNYVEFLSKISAYYRYCLTKEVKILDYLKRIRKFNTESIDVFEIGFGGSEDLLKEFVDQNGLDRHLLLDTGVCYLDDSGNLRDRMRDRIVFPILDLEGNTIGFSGRVTKEREKREIAKYGKIKGKFINTPNTLVFRKRFAIYGGFQAIEDIKNKNYVIVVEGNPDVIMMHQHKFFNTVAPCGTALTLEQLYLLKSMTKNIVISTDNDNAGRKAFERIVDLNKILKANLKRLLVYETKDLDDYLKTHNSTALEKTIQNLL